MPLYFADFQDGEDVYYDAIGCDFEEFEQACKQAIVALKEIAKGRTQNYKHREVIVFIRNESEGNLYKATLRLYGKHCSVVTWPEARARSRQLLVLKTMQKLTDGLSQSAH